ncbi:hypothetical protein ANN_22052 [Periplaneta americana]|uniref:Uncharacterized protein n=1 Tax=Periplaneta americana TaxID=6978 RepID=A0ABQ8S7D4_PERAM|nr:hypothetical protein ANN_22052 [Periplaneta americana]
MICTILMRAVHTRTNYEHYCLWNQVDEIGYSKMDKCYVLFNDVRNCRGYIRVAGVPEFCPAGVLLHASKSTDLNAIDLARDRTFNLGHRRPALYHCANQADYSRKKHYRKAMVALLSVLTCSLMLAGNEFQSLGRAIVKEDEYEETQRRVFFCSRPGMLESGLSANDDSGYNCSANDRFLWPSKVNVDICSSEKNQYFRVCAHLTTYGTLLQVRYNKINNIKLEIWSSIKSRMKLAYNDQVYVPPLPFNLEELNNWIHAPVARVDRDMLQRVWQELDYRVDVCRGGHIEHL